MALVENLRRLSDQVIRARHARARADALADRLLGVGGDGGVAASVRDLVRDLDDTPLAGAFAVQLVQRLRDQDASITPALDWLNQRLAAQGTSPGEVVTRELHAQGAANATVRNLISSMRWMSSIDWLEFVESVSLVDEVLRDAPAYSAMDFATRDEYRRQIELLSRGSKRSELEVAREAVQLGRSAAEERPRAPRPDPESEASGCALGLPGVPERAEEDPGYYLVSAGR